MRILEVLKKEQFNKNTHDLGFMMYCSFGNANVIHPTNEYKEILTKTISSDLVENDLKEAQALLTSWD